MIIGLRSWDWLGHSRSSNCFLLSNSFVVGGVFGIIVVLESKPLLIFNAVTDSLESTWNHSLAPQHRWFVFYFLEKNSHKAWCFHCNVSGIPCGRSVLLMVVFVTLDLAPCRSFSRLLLYFVLWFLLTVLSFLIYGIRALNRRRLSVSCLFSIF